MLELQSEHPAPLSVAQTNVPLALWLQVINKMYLTQSNIMMDRIGMPCLDWLSAQHA